MESYSAFECLDGEFYDLSVAQKIARCRALAAATPEPTDERKTLVAVADVYEMLFVQGKKPRKVDRYVRSKLFGLAGSRMAAFAISETISRLDATGPSDLWHYA